MSKRGKPFTKADKRINRKGRPKRVVTDLRVAAREFTPLALEVLASVASSKRAAAIARVKAATQLLLAGWGSPPQSVSVDLPPPGPGPSVEFIFVSKKPPGWSESAGNVEPTPAVN
jgi:hypothetical protein